MPGQGNIERRKSKDYVWFYCIDLDIGKVAGSGMVLLDDWNRNVFTDC